MISIIIVNYNVSFLLEKCLHSIYREKSNVSFEIIVIDNNSSNPSIESLQQKFPRVIWIQNKSNLGFARAVNQGFKRGNGNIFLLLNPDAYLDSKSLSLLEDFFEKHPDAGIVGGKIRLPNGMVQPQCRRNFPTPQAAFFRLFGLHRFFPQHPLAQQYELPFQEKERTQTVQAVSGALMATTRETLKEAGMLDEGFFLYGEDLDFCLRMRNLRKNVYYFPSLSATHHWGASRRKNPVKTLFYTHYAMFRFYKKHDAISHHSLFNCLMYFAIWFRWLAMILKISPSLFVKRQHHENRI